MAESIDLSVVVVAYNSINDLPHCIDSIAAAAHGVTYEILVVDNASCDGSADWLRQHCPQVSLLASRQNLGFAAGNNLAFQHARGRHIALINPDARPQAGTLSEAVRWLDAHPAAGLVGGRLIDEAGTAQPAARCFPTPWRDFCVLSGLSAWFPKSRWLGGLDRGWADPLAPAQVDWIPGAFIVLRKAALFQVGLFDERFFLYYEEVDLCQRLRRIGFEVHYQPQWLAIHAGGNSSRSVASGHFNHHGSQLTLWRMRSALMYYRKQHGLRGVWLAYLLEQGWHGLRCLRHAFSGGNRIKQAESRVQLRLLGQAWDDTQGGRQSPPRPW